MRRLHKLTYPEIEELVAEGVDTVIIPVGTLEPHGNHLPVGTDSLIAEILAERVAEKINALVAPTIHHGVTRSLYGYGGASTVPEEVFEEYVFHVARSLSNFFNYIVFMNGHGGNTESLRRVVKRLRLKERIPAMNVDRRILMRELSKKILGGSGHAGIDETAVIMAVYPELVKEPNEDEVFFYRPGLSVYPLTGTIILYEKDENGNPIGFPKGLTKEKAQEYLDKLVEELSKIIAEVVERRRESR